MAHIKPTPMGSASMAGLITKLLDLHVKQLQEHLMFEEHGDAIYIGVERACLFVSSAMPRKGRYSSGTDIVKSGLWGDKFEAKRHGVPYMVIPFTAPRLHSISLQNTVRIGELYKLNKREFLVRLQHEGLLRAALEKAGVQR